VRKVYPQAPEAFLEQARLVIADLPVAGIKIGLLGSAGIADAVAEVLDAAGDLPVVLDPILAAGGGHPLAGDALLQALRSRLIPRASVPVTPNTPEARRLTGAESPDECAAALLAMGCRNVLLTGAHEDGETVVNRWYGERGRVDQHWPRLPQTYHGSGCTLASALAGALARGLPMAEAVAQAQRLTWESLRAGYALGRGQWLPRR